VSAHARRGRVDFPRVAEATLSHADTLCRRWLPDGRADGHEWVARNPRRSDHRPGSFKINLSTGRWGDFAEGKTGGDMISLAAYLFGLSQRDAALKISEMLGINPYG
jgi:hypothetical protein